MTGVLGVWPEPRAANIRNDLNEAANDFYAFQIDLKHYV